MMANTSSKAAAGGGRRLRVWVLAAAFAALRNASCTSTLLAAGPPRAGPPFEVQIVSPRWDPAAGRLHAPPGISIAGDTVTVVAPMEFSTVCHTVDVDVTGAPGPEDGEATITVHIKRPRSTLRSGEACILLAGGRRFVIVTIPGLRPGDYLIEVLAPIPYFKGFALPVRTPLETREPEEAVATPTQCETLSGLTARCIGRARIR